MLPETTLIALACLIANKGPVDTADIEAKLNDSDKVAVQQIIDKGTCTPEKVNGLLPEKLEIRIRETHDERNENGGSQGGKTMHSPTWGCE